MSKNTDIPVLTFPEVSQWKKWLDQNHEQAEGAWIRFFKKESKVTGVTYAKVLDEALCYGWIDGQVKKYDEQSWIQKFTPRRPRSVWSKRNVEHVKRLTKAGRMKPAGLKQVEAAQADGRWEKAYDSPANMETPEDFLKELAKNKKAKAFFETLNKTNKYAINWRLQTAKKPETREKRMKKILEMLANGEKFH